MKTRKNGQLAEHALDQNIPAAAAGGTWGRAPTARRSSIARWVSGIAAGVTFSGALGGLVTPAAAATSNTHAFPLRQVDLPAGANWQISGHGDDNPRDLSASRFDANEKRWIWYKGSIAAYEADPDNSDHIGFGAPVFSPVNGTIIDCWRNHPENITPRTSANMDGVSHPGRIPDANGKRRIIGAGNHMNILTDDGRVVLLAHLKAGSMPSALCPFDAEFVTDADAKVGEWLPESVIPAANRPRISQGQFVGSVGNTGASSLPHLHIHIKPVTDATTDPPTIGASMPFNFHGVFTRSQNPAGDVTADWKPLQDGPLPGDTGQIHASPFVYGSGEPGGDASESATVEIPGIGAATATRNESGNLEFTTHKMDGTLKVVETEQAGAASEIAAVRTAGGNVVTAMRDGAGNLKLIGWDIKLGGFFSRTGEASAGAVSEVAITRAPTPIPGVVTAVRDSAGVVKVITWLVDDVTGTITRVDDAIGVAATELSVTSVTLGRALATGSTLTFKGVVTAARNAQGLLRLDSWKVTPDLQVVRTGQVVSEPVSKVSATTVRLDSARDAVVTGLRDGGGNLRLKSWAVDAAGGFKHHDNAYGNAIQDIKLSDSGRDAIGTIKDANGHLRLMVWRTFNDGKLERHGENFLGAPLSHMSLSSPVVIGGTRYVIGTFGTPIIDMTIAWRYSM